MFLGRESERKTLEELVGGIRQRGGALLVRGEAGIGKSRLLVEAGVLAPGPARRTLVTKGVESEQQLAYAGLHQALYPLRAGIDALPGAQRAALRAALGITDDTVRDMHIVGLAALTLLSDAAAETPLVIVAEDAQWLDASSVDVLTFVARRLASEPIVLIATVRDDAPSRLDAAGLPVLLLERLPEAIAADLLDAVAPELAPPLRSVLLAEAAGNPLALTELPVGVTHREGVKPPSGTASSLPDRLVAAFTARVRSLPPETRTSLLVAALNDGGTLAETLEAARALLGRSVGVEVLWPAVDTRLLELVGGTVRFRHPLMRAAIPQAASAAERQTAHRALADALHDQPDRRAWQRAAAVSGSDEEIAAELELSAARARRRGGAAAAVAALRQSARLSASPHRRTERLLRAAELAFESGLPQTVRDLVAEVTAGDISARQRARATWILSDFDDGMRGTAAGPLELAELAESIAADGDHALAERILWSAGMRCFWTEPGRAARRRVARVADGLPTDPHSPLMLAISAYAAPVSRGRAVVDAFGKLSHGDGEDTESDHFLLSAAALQVGAFDASTRFAAASLSGLRATGRLGLLARSLAVRAASATRLGDLAVALPTAEEAGRLAQETDQPYMYGLARAVQAEIAALRGEYEQTRRLAAEAEQVGLAAGARPILATVQAARGKAALGEGRYADALGDLLRMHDPAEPAYQPAFRCYSLAELADAGIRAGRPDAVRSVVAELEELAEQTPSPALHAGLRYVRAVLEPDGAAEVLFTSALAYDLTGWPLERARLQLAFGEWLRRRRRPQESRQRLRAARDAFDALGMAPWSERARKELRAAGEASPRRSPHVYDRLTAQELSIAQLAAAGLTNREIGERLYLSHRTVSTHLHHIFPKLNIASRTELAEALRDGSGPQQV